LLNTLKTSKFEVEYLYERQVSNATQLDMMIEMNQMLTHNITEAMEGIKAAQYFINPDHSDRMLKSLIDEYEFYELLRWPITLGFLTFLLFLCTVLVIGVARSSRCLLIFFSVLGLFTVAICWLLSGVYLAASVAAADFCVAPDQHICNQQRLGYIFQTNCGPAGSNHFVIRLRNSKDNMELAKKALYEVERVGRMLFPKQNIPQESYKYHEILDASLITIQSKFKFHWRILIKSSNIIDIYHRFN
jgi:protein tweety